MTARFLIGDVRERMAQLPHTSFDVIITSPPFLALRSYLPAGHPGKAQEIGSEATPADFLNVLLDLTAEWGRLLAPHGSLVVELGDTYAGSGGQGGDYLPGGSRDGQPGFDGSAARTRADGNGKVFRGGGRQKDKRGTKWDRPGKVHPANGAPYADTFKGGGPGGAGWPLDKSLCGIPHLYAWSLAYGRNLLTGEPSPAGMWRIRNVKPWIRSNPPVGALGDKERPATSYIVVATRARDRYFDLDAVRGPACPTTNQRTAAGVASRPNTTKAGDDDRTGGNRSTLAITDDTRAGAPPLDWWHHVDAVLDAELDRLAGKRVTGGIGNEKHASPARGTGGDARGYHLGRGGETAGARGVHLRRALERAAILVTVDALDVSPKGYKGAHYAVWPTQLVRLLLAEMCPRRVCTVCGQPSRRIVEAEPSPYTGLPGVKERRSNGRSKGPLGPGSTGIRHNAEGRRATTVGWSDCGHDAWRPGRVLDPFVGSGTTLEVATGMGFEATGIDIDLRNALLALDRVGPLLLDIDWPEPDFTLLTLPGGSPHPADYAAWITDQQAGRVLDVFVTLAHTAIRHHPDAEPSPTRRAPTPVAQLAGQLALVAPAPQPEED